jgi:LacI family transcriptional regulator
MAGVPSLFELTKIMAPTTIKDIARASGYSIKTVSRVINRQTTVAPDIREKIEAVIAKFDYQPNIWARALRSSRSHLIALFSSDPIVAYVNRIQVAAAAACQKAGYHLIFEVTPPERNVAKTIKDIVETVHLDGALLVPPVSDSLPFMKAMLGTKVPFVRISPYENLEIASYVHIDDAKVAYDMASYLIELGHRHIGFVGGPKGHTAAGQRHRGFVAAMNDHGIAIRPEWMVPGQFDVQSGMQAGEALLSGRVRPTAILASTDDSAIGVLAVAYSKGIAVPRNLSIVGIDDAPIASSFWPKLTTIRQPVADLGRVATEMLIREIEVPGERQIEQLDCEIIVRESAGPPLGSRRASARSR